MSQESSYNTQRICRIFASGGTCRFGSNCRFYHQVATNHENESVIERSDLGGTTGRAPVVCRAYAERRFCKFGARCRYFHPIISHKPNNNASDQKFKNGGLKSENVFRRREEEDVSGDSYFHLPLPLQRGHHQVVHKPNRNVKQNLRVTQSNCNRSSNVTSRRVVGRTNHEAEISQEVGVEVLQDAANKVSDEQPSEANIVEKSGIQSTPQHNTRKRLCKFFKAGRCYNGSSCRFWHPDHNGEERGAYTGSTRDIRRKEVFQNPAQVVLKGLSENDQKKIYSSETKQLDKRYPKAVRINGEDGRCTYTFTFIPSDPDWPYDVKNVVLKVSFPGQYPLKPMCVTVVKDQKMPEVVIRCTQTAITEWIEARFNDIAALGKAELMFCSFIKWLDRHLEEIMTDGLREYRRDLMAAAAGVQFVSASSLREQYPEAKHPGDDESEEHEDEEEDEESEDDDYDGEVPPQPGHVGEMPPESGHENHTTSTERKGTEVKLRELQLLENAATLMMKKVKVIVLCGRCKNKKDVTMTSQRPVQVTCDKCTQDMIVAYRPTMAHQFSSIVGYLDVSSCQAFDLVLLDCVFNVGCFNCDKEATIEGLSTGQPKEFFCRHCHKKIKICTESVRLQQLQPSELTDMSELIVEEVKKKTKIPKDPAIQEGRSLPDEGTCKHFKKSNRWLRFPCCGKAYPCDICHEEHEGGDHEMIFANRMICGFCCREQVYSSDKPCVSCGFSLIKKGSSHWEGGTGCRDKIKMSRDDKKKYSNMGKVLSKKSYAKITNKKTTKLRHT